MAGMFTVECGCITFVGVYSPTVLKCLPDDKILALSKLKAFVLVKLIIRR